MSPNFYNDKDIISFLISFQSGTSNIKRKIKHYYGLQDEDYDKLSYENRVLLYRMIKEFNLNQKSYSPCVTLDIDDYEIIEMFVIRLSIIYKNLTLKFRNMIRKNLNCEFGPSICHFTRLEEL